jgi:AcrR family transcriptional regulator
LATRTYNVESRRRQQAALKARIVAATVALHAAKGALATRYADIARQAGVSPPTVYKHFPTHDALLQGCTAHVAAMAPPLPVDRIIGAVDLGSAASLLVAAIERRHLHFEPWLAWREDRVIPFLATISAGMRDGQAALLARLLKRHLGRGEPRAIVAGWESMLSFDLWHRLVRGHRLPRAAARRILVQCLLAIAGPPPASSRKPRPRRSSP